MEKGNRLILRYIITFCLTNFEFDFGIVFLFSYFDNFFIYLFSINFDRTVAFIELGNKINSFQQRYLYTKVLRFCNLIGCMQQKGNSNYV